MEDINTRENKKIKSQLSNQSNLVSSLFNHVSSIHQQLKNTTVKVSLC
ncbi:hypothetical protein DFA_10332 [Cavenderia fasciculata]|uniref:Uncharacterized protein n=1 Tax=Cavenderia fasciculata TaxID=261658 RepID=F4Q9X3_CACFS|nr:uncharacterized protein DFA_10332 [Cavenderia fasciculata]EGG15492.1 hypothetical protein DFA_10332 [Cavenderia fasciculata]|eukprot:XP_004354234.1 hypothetical protein DFA_10332 [Cavenderia fasciculata]